MAILIVSDTLSGQIKNSLPSVIAYAKAIASKESLPVSLVLSGGFEDSELSKINALGLTKIFTKESDLSTALVNHLVEQQKVKYLLFTQSSSTNEVASKFSVLHNVSYVNNIIGEPIFEQGFSVQHLMFSGKAHAFTSLSSDLKILGIKNSSLTPDSVESISELEKITFDEDQQDKKYEIKKITKSAEGIPLTEAEIIVSGGRGLQSADNWGIIEELAEVLGAAKGCSKPVSDMGWREHHEHIGQTGVKVSPNLYIAVGISGAIQHLAGVANSKSILVINKDPEAPFFKVATYGIIGDAFQVLPKLTAAIKTRKNT